VTVLQHILDEQRLEQAINRLAKHLAPDGTMVLLEAAPTRATTRCDSAVFRARGLDTYLTLFDRCRLIVEAVTGVDPMPCSCLTTRCCRNRSRWRDWLP
jgi:hypothetical protein